jgi:hypothetical protein
MDIKLAGCTLYIWKPIHSSAPRIPNWNFPLYTTAHFCTHFVLPHTLHYHEYFVPLSVIPQPKIVLTSDDKMGRGNNSWSTELHTPLAAFSIKSSLEFSHSYCIAWPFIIGAMV